MDALFIRTKGRAIVSALLPLPACQSVICLVFLPSSGDHGCARRGRVQHRRRCGHVDVETSDRPTLHPRPEISYPRAGEPTHAHHKSKLASNDSVGLIESCAVQPSLFSWFESIRVGSGRTPRDVFRPTADEHISWHEMRPRWMGKIWTIYDGIDVWRKNV